RQCCLPGGNRGDHHIHRIQRRRREFSALLEEWTNKTLTYNGSMVVMFQSKFATAPWVNIGIYYNPPTRNWAFDQNFSDPTGSKLPPATPAASTLIRGTWRVAQPKSTNTVVSL